MSALSLFDPASACNALSSIVTSSFNTTILNATYYSGPASVVPLGYAYTPTVNVTVPLCRVQLIAHTSSISSLKIEAWFPTEWNGRYLSVGNGGLEGSIYYEDVGYGTTLGFATVGSDNGHEGDTAVPFLNNNETLADFTSRAIHVETIIGKELVKSYYNQHHNRSYYLGCSNGGRQGIYAALHHPSDFDGILAGAPAVNWNRLNYWSGMMSKYVGAPEGNSSASFIPFPLWDVIHAEIFNQCDTLDGVADGIITEPDLCNFQPEALLCTANKTQDCLTPTQVGSLRNIYSPLYGDNGVYLFPRFDPGAEKSSYSASFIFTGQPFPYTVEWMGYAIHNDPNWNFSSFSLADLALANKVDPGQISTFNGNLSAFRNRGGKLVQYHGRADDIITSGNSKRFYRLVEHTLQSPPSKVDEFYRLFLVPGMEHCYGGTGPVRFGQMGNGTLPQGSSQSATNNILLALVDWVENGNAPENITGVSDDGQTTRTHCRFPQMRSQWTGEKWTCVNGTVEIAL